MIQRRFFISFAPSRINFEYKKYFGKEVKKKNVRVNDVRNGLGSEFRQRIVIDCLKFVTHDYQSRLDLFFLLNYTDLFSSVLRTRMYVDVRTYVSKYIRKA